MRGKRPNTVEITSVVDRNDLYKVYHTIGDILDWIRQENPKPVATQRKFLWRRDLVRILEYLHYMENYREDITK